MSNQLRLLVFIVVISGALCTVEDYVIMSQCAHNKAIHLAAEGTVSVTDISKTQNITIVGLPDYVNNDFKITLYAKETQRYLCFNENWKLVGMREIQETCYFNETIVHGYFVFRSVIDLQRRVGFTHRGKAIGPKKNVTDACYLFTKIHAEQFFHHQHTHNHASKTKTTTKQTLTSTSATAATAPTRLGTTAADPDATSSLSSAIATPNRTKGTRNKHNNRNKTNGMRNNSNTNQNRQNNQGHNSNISNNSNSINLSSIKEQQLNVSNNTTQQQQQQHHHRHHQVRHHHNDPNVVARRHQHEHKPRQKQRRQRMRARATASPTTTTVNTITTAEESQFYSKSVGSNKTAHSKKAAKITPSTMLPTASTTHELPIRMRTATSTVTTSTVANKRKGRRRKTDRMHKKQQQQQHLQQMQQQLPANAKDPQHRQPYRSAGAAAEPTAAIRQLWTTTHIDEQEEYDGVSASSSSSADDFTLSSDWTSASVEPAKATVEVDFAASPTSPTLASAASYWAATTSLDFDASQASLAADDNLAAANYATMLSNMMTDNDDVATSPIDIGATSAVDTPFSTEAKSTAPTSYDLDNSWTADSTMNDDFSTLSLEGKQTPILSTQFAARNKFLWSLTTDDDAEAAESTATTLGDNSSSSSSSSSNLNSVATDGMLYSEATAETSTTFDEDKDDKNEDIFTTSQSKLSSHAAKNIEDNIIDLSRRQKHHGNSNIVAKPYFSSPTATYANISPTLATIMQQKLLHTTATKHEETLATDAAMSSSSIGSNNLNDDSLTEYVLSTRTSDVHNKNHRNRQQHRNGSQEQQQLASTSSSSSSSIPHRNLGLNSNKNKNAYNTKLSRNKLFGKAAAGTTSATYLSTAGALAAFVTQNHREMLFADIQQEEEEEAADYFSNNHSLISINKNINNQQQNNTLFSDFDGSSSSTGFSHSDIAATPALAAATANIITQPTSFSTSLTASSTSSSSSSTSSSSSLASTTKKHFRKSTQKLMATPFHQLTAYVRNPAGDIDIDNMDNISVYPDLLDVDVVHNNGSSSSESSGINDNFMNASNSRMTIVSGYLPTSATATLPESIRIAKIRYNKERKRMLRQRFGGSGGRYA